MGHGRRVQRPRNLLQPPPGRIQPLPADDLRTRPPRHHHTAHRTGRGKALRSARRETAHRQRTAHRQQHTERHAAQDLPGIPRTRRRGNPRHSHACQGSRRRPLRLLHTRRETLLLHRRRLRKRRTRIPRHGRHTEPLPNHLHPRIGARPHRHHHERGHGRDERREHVRHPLHRRARPAHRAPAILQRGTLPTHPLRSRHRRTARGSQLTLGTDDGMEVRGTGNAHRTPHHTLPLHRRTHRSRGRRPPPLRRTANDGRHQPGTRRRETDL